MRDKNHTRNPTLPDLCKRSRKRTQINILWKHQTAICRDKFYTYTSLSFQAGKVREIYDAWNFFILCIVKRRFRVS